MGPRRAIGGPRTPPLRRARRGRGRDRRLGSRRLARVGRLGLAKAAPPGNAKGGAAGKAGGGEGWGGESCAAGRLDPARRRLAHPPPARASTHAHMHSRTRGARMCTNAHAHTNLSAALASCVRARLVTGGRRGRPHRCRAVCPPPLPARTAAPLGQVPRFYADPGLGPEVGFVCVCVCACVRACCVRTGEVVRSRTVQGCWSCCCRRSAGPVLSLLSVPLSLFTLSPSIAVALPLYLFTRIAPFRI